MISMAVPDWFARLGHVPDADIAAEEDLPRSMVTMARRALSIKSHQQTNLDDRTWEQSLELMNSGVPRHMWPSVLGFVPSGRLTAMQVMTEWLYCREQGLDYDLTDPKLPH